MKLSKKNIIKLLAVTAAGVALISSKVGAQPVNLSGTNYFQNFDDLSGGLEPGWLIYTGATGTSLGVLTSFTNGNPALTVNDWNNFSFGFKNCASTNYTPDGTNFIGTEPIATQALTANRVLAVRTTGANDPGNAFVLKVANTVGLGKFVLDVDMMMLSPQTRSNNWTLDFGVSPDGISPPATFTIISNNFFGSFTNASAFGSYHKTIDCAGLLDDQQGPIWIRIVNRTASTGAGNRPTVGIDNFNLTFTNVPSVPRAPTIVSQPQGVTNLEFTTTSLGVGVGGTSPFTYQWFKDGSPLSDGTTISGSTISGSTSPALTITGSRAGDSGSYSVTVTNSVDGTNSNPATVLINPRPFAITNIAYLRTLVDNNFLATNSISLWQVTGTITTLTNQTSGNTASYYLQDGSGGINIFETFGSSFRPAQGDVVTFVGFLSSFNSTLELEADPVSVPVTGPTILSNNIAGLPAPRLISLSVSNNISFVETNLEASMVMIKDVYFAATNAGGIIGTTNLTAIVTNTAGEFFMVAASAQDLDVVNGTNTWPTYASTIIGPLIQNLPNTTTPRNAGYQLS
ncbi:MAG TPA: immunoglobulin domain-containing protein, partial [Verrucomicrobiae bacterium]|nr:immunoglobulin domain-containing protein [Verrucomicrobiae bacterium]